MRRDIDAFFGLFIDNLVNVLIITAIMKFVFEAPDWVVFERVIPGIAILLIVGNFYYAWLAKKLAEKEKRTDVTALPYGICTPTMFAWLFLIIGPVYWLTDNPVLAWQVGVAAAFIGGIVEILGAWIGPTIRRLTPRAALLGTLAGIAITFIATTPSAMFWEFPAVGFVVMAFILVCFVARIVLPGRVPGGLLAIILGSIIAWSLVGVGLGGFSPADPEALAAAQLRPSVPIPVIGDIIAGFAEIIPFLAIVVPFSIYNFLETMQNLESAAAAGDEYPTKECMIVDGLGTTMGSIFGNPFPSTVYIGHPGWKAVGGRAGYSILNATVITILCWGGLVAYIGALLPKAIVAPILLYIGMVIMAQAFQTSPKKYAPAITLAFVPWIAGFTKTAVDGALGAAGTSAAEVGYEVLALKGVQYGGFENLGYGAIVTAMILVAIGVHLIDRRFRDACIWSIAATILAFFGVINAPGMGFAAAPAFALGWFILAVIFLAFWTYERRVKKLEVVEVPF